MICHLAEKLGDEFICSALNDYCLLEKPNKEKCNSMYGNIEKKSADIDLIEDEECYIDSEEEI